MSGFFYSAESKILGRNRPSYKQTNNGSVTGPIVDGFYSGRILPSPP